jgi:hypothetical protein
MANKEIIVYQLNNILKNIALAPANGRPPEDIGWEEFIARHPNFVQHEYGTALRVAEGARPILDEQPAHKQKLAGAILRTYFTNEQIEEYGREEI